MQSPLRLQYKNQKNLQSTKLHTKHADKVEGSKYCTKHNNCIEGHHQKQHQSQDSFFSCPSQFLQSEALQDISCMPQIQIQAKPEVDALIQANLKIKKYEKLYQKLEKEQTQKIRKQNLKNLQQERRKALSRSKKRIQSDKNKAKWGHTIFGQPSNYNQQHKQKQTNQEKKDIKQQTQKPIQLKPIQERIKQYNQRQYVKKQQQQKKQICFDKKGKLDQKEIEKANQKIAQNANKLLIDQKRQANDEKDKLIAIKAKIKAVQLASLQNVKKCKKKLVPVMQKQQTDFSLGDSQYSTFQARLQGRKSVKKLKNKNKKGENNSKDQLSKTSKPISSRRQYKPPNSKKLNKTQKTNNNQPKTINQLQQSQQQILAKKNQKFYMWNIPITNQQCEKVIKDNLELQQNNKENHQLYFSQKEYKKSFRQEVNEFIQNKMMKKMQDATHQNKQSQFQTAVQRQKRRLMKEWDQMNKQRYANQLIDLIQEDY